MAQPFREGKYFDSAVWPELQLFYHGDYLLIRSESSLETISSALWRGGNSLARCFINGRVPLEFRSDHPKEMLHRQINEWGYPPNETVGMLTAARLTHASVYEESGDQFRLLCCATAGTGNGARAGVYRPTFAAYQPGTINLFLFIDGKLTSAAMVNAIMTSTEAKCAALQDLHITDKEMRIVTGTTSDAVCLAVSQSDHYTGTHEYAGTATTIGNAIGRLVYQAVYEAVSTQKEG